MSVVAKKRKNAPFEQEREKARQNSARHEHSVLI